MANHKPVCFIAPPTGPLFETVESTMAASAMQAGYNVVGSPMIPAAVTEWTTDELAKAECLVADVSQHNASTFFLVGLAHSLGKGIVLICDEFLTHELPLALHEYSPIQYKRDPNGIVVLGKRLGRVLSQLRKHPKKKTLSRNASQPFFIDWEKLTIADKENLCKELFIRMGFRSLDWAVNSPEFDLMAELPKKDPDGFEYREYWFISLGLRAPSEMLLDIAAHDPDYLVHRLTRHLEESRIKQLSQSGASITLLVVNFRRNDQVEDDYRHNEILRLRSKRYPFANNIRLRVWNQNYINSLIHKYPQIGYKYFSDEARLRSETRKGYEELYEENVQILEQQRALVAELEEERGRRVSAERDAIWKDISFAAAHKIGNPIFAVETDLDPLVKRINDERKVEAIEVVDNIRSAIEKAKGFVEQFKSLAKAQQIEQAPVNLRPILEDSVRVACNHRIVCEISCDPNLKVLGDAERLAECFDELTANSMHFFDKNERIISVSVTVPAIELLPAGLKPSTKFALIHFRDNGCGIPIADKGRIFDAFFTTYDHGTGLGLALVRRIIEGHYGFIAESGIPGEGVDFEIYLPLA